MATQLLLTEAEAGAVLHLSRTTLRKLWRDGRLVPIKIGRSVRYTQQDVDAFVQQLVAERRDAAF